MSFLENGTNVSCRSQIPLLKLLTSTLCNGEHVIITGFGTFGVRDKSTRKGRNPRTGEAIVIGPRKAVSFRPSALWKAEVNAAPSTNIQG
jgi:integration host factor subunit alpha